MEEDTWESKKNLKNMMELVEDFEKKYHKEEEDNRKQKKTETCSVEDCQEDIQQSCYTVEEIRSMIRNTESGWRKTKNARRKTYFQGTTGICS